MITKEAIQSMIQAGLPDATVDVIGDDGAHFQATVMSPSFAGHSVVAQHRMVYATLGDKMGGEIHALALSTRVPPAAD